MSKKNNNQFVNIVFNILIPIIVLTKFSKEAYLGPVYGLLIALSFPLIYGLYELLIQKQKNFISIIGFAGVLLLGIIGIFKFPPHWVAVKEAAIPLIIGVVVLISTKTSWQLIKKVIYNRELLDIDQIESKLYTEDSKFRLKTTLVRANILLACSFFFSATLNYILAKVIVHSMPGTTQFNEEIGRMTMLSYPVIALPSLIILGVILWYIFSTLKSLTQLSTEELLSEQLRNKK